MVESGAVEMFFTSDSPAGVGDRGSIPGVLQTANFNNGPDSQFDALVNQSSIMMKKYFLVFLKAFYD